MDLLLYLAAALVAATGAAHSILGERYILVRLFRRTDLPHVFGSPVFTRHALRFAWHLTTIAWWGLAAIIVLIARDRGSPSAVLIVLSATCLLSALVAAVGSRGRHLSWLVFAIVGTLLWFSASAHR